MTTRSAVAGRDWWTPHALLAIFCVLVGALLAAVPGWSAPLHAWIALAGLTMALLAADAGVRALRGVIRTRWRDARTALSVAVSLGMCAGALMHYGRAHLVSPADAMLPAAPAAASEAP